MRTHQASAGHDIPATLSHLVGTEVTALALVGTVGDGPMASVAAYITPGAAASPLFRHAVEMEGTYSDTLLSFDENAPPYYGGTDLHVDLGLAARELGFDRVLCLVTLDSQGKVSVCRDYDGLEVTLLEAANVQFNRFMDILDDVIQVPAARMVQ